MRRQVLGLVVLAALAAGGCVTAPPPPVRLYVHVDRLAADKVQSYEAARLRFASLLRQHGVSDHTGLYLKVGDTTYYAVASFGRWGDLDRLRAQQGRALGHVDHAAVERYWHDSDEALVFPHAGEIWVEQPSVSYVPTGRRLGDAVEVVFEDVAPTAEAAYEAAWRQIAAALARAHYPVERRTYFSSPGTGRMVSFWLAPSAAVARAAPTVAEAVAGVLGVERAAELMRRWRACVVGAESFAVEAQPEMSSF